MRGGLETELLRIVRELRALEHGLRVLRSRDNANSRTLQAEIAARIDEREQQLADLRATIQNGPHTRS